MNALTVIHCYKWNGMWVFDDSDKGLQREPFVVGVPEILDALRAMHGVTGDEFNIVFSVSEFPGHHAKAEWVAEHYDGNWYTVNIAGRACDGWLCPALLKYFDAAPKQIYFQVMQCSEARTGNGARHGALCTNIGEDK